MPTIDEILGALETVSAKLSEANAEDCEGLLREREEWIRLLAQRPDLRHDLAPRLARIAAEGDAFRERLLRLREQLQLQAGELARHRQWCEACEKTL